MCLICEQPEEAQCVDVLRAPRQNLPEKPLGLTRAMA